MAETIELTDAKGRKLTFRALNSLEQMRLLRAVGPGQSSNMPYVHNVEAAASVRAIDGHFTISPVNERTIDAMIERLGDEGMAAAAVQAFKNMQAVMKAAEDAQEEGGEVSDDPLAASAS